MNIIGKNVEHCKFGEGKIVSVNEDKVKIEFESTVKVFLYPDSFEKFIIIKDKKAKQFLDTWIEEINEVKRQEREEKNQKIEMHNKKVKKKESTKKKTNTHAVFAMQINDWQEVMDNWKVSTGKYSSRSSKGKPRIPRNMNAGSACLLTRKPDGGSEEERTIFGIFMVEENFVGLHCVNGIIPAHKKYRIVWEPEMEELLFWSYFPEEARLSKWGSSEMKYVSETVVQRVLEDMMKITQGDERQKKIEEFYSYFEKINDL